MITFFTLPKGFTGHIGMIQRNAIRSWRELGGDVEVLLLGEEDGLAGVARACGARHLPEILRTRHGTPLVSDAFERAVRAARHERLCYVNADIILMDDILAASAKISFRRFLAVGRRTDLDLREPIAFDTTDWRARLRDELAARGQPHPIHGIDYFLFSRSAGIEPMPTFSVGRPGWDNWLLRETRRRGVPVIDTSDEVTAIHQDHDYGHVPGGDGQSSEGPEADENLRLMGSTARPYDLLDATHLLTTDGPQRALTREHMRRRRDRMVEAQPWLRRPIGLATRAYRIAEPLLRAAGVVRGR